MFFYYVVHNANLFLLLRNHAPFPEAADLMWTIVMRNWDEEFSC